MGRQGRGVLARAGAALAVAALALLPAASPSAASTATPKVKHVFVIVLENEDYASTFGPTPPAPYLGADLPRAGAFVPGYYGIGHASLDNYLAMISGQPPNLGTQADCPVFTEMTPGNLNTLGVAEGQGCVYPASVATVANQLEQAGHTWHGYMEDMAVSGSPVCGHPPVGSPDPTIGARRISQYTTRHDPFVYFHSIIDSQACAENVVDLGELPAALRTEASTPEYSFITPDLCADGHDATCADPSQPGGYQGIETFLRTYVPLIQASPAYQDRGMILITFDESATSAEACCGETNGPNTPNNGGSISGPGGGKVGAVMLSPCIRPGTVSKAYYNHYSMLRWVEDNFGLGHLANAAGPVGAFGSDVFTRPDCERKTRLSVKPRHATEGRPTTFHFRLRAGLQLCREKARIRFGGRTVRTDRRGEAKLRLPLQGHGAVRAVAHPTICLPAKVAVRVRPRG